MRDRLWRWPIPMVIDRTRRGTHDRADATGPCRGCATAVSCRAAGRTSRRVCPRPLTPSLLCTLHIGGSNLKSRATCDSAVLPRTSRRPRVSGHVRCVRSIATDCKRKAFGAVTSIRSHDCDGDARRCTIGGGLPYASLLLPAGRAHPLCIAQGRCSWHARRLTQIGRQRPL